MQSSGGLLLGAATAITPSSHRLHIRSCIGDAMPPGYRGAAFVMEWGLRAISQTRKRPKAATDTTMYCNEAHHLLSRYEAGGKVKSVPPGTLLTMTDQRFTRYTRAEINSARTQENLQAFEEAVKMHLEAMEKQTEGIKGADPNCPACRSSKVVHTGSKQIRSSDEPMTEFYACKACGEKWRVG